MHKNLEGFIKPGSPEEKLVNCLDFSKLPRHVAVIMDGNGRWAKKRKLPRIEGHRSGAESVQEVVETSARLGLKYLTLYAFSKENWKRPKTEVATLWKLLLEYLKKEDKVLMENQFKLNVIGQIDQIPKNTRKELDRVIKMTKNNTRLVVTLALNYSGRQEILDAVKSLCSHPDDLENLDEDGFSRYLYTANIPDPDLLIRTSGELRISNFLLWQIAYSEIWITPVLWPDFRRMHMLEALIDFQKRERRFGDVHAH